MTPTRVDDPLRSHLEYVPASLHFAIDGSLLHIRDVASFAPQYMFTCTSSICMSSHLSVTAANPLKKRAVLPGVSCSFDESRTKLLDARLRFQPTSSGPHYLHTSQSTGLQSAEQHSSGAGGNNGDSARVGADSRQSIRVLPPTPVPSALIFSHGRPP